MLGRLEQKHLEYIMLPLSEIRKKEVEKIGELIKVEYLNRPKDKIHQIMKDQRMIPLVEARSSRDLRRTGSIYDYRLESSICEHLGIHRYHIGQKNLPSKPEQPIDENKEIISIIPFKGNIFIDYPDRLKYSHALICRFLPAANLDTTVPMSVYVKMSSSGEKIPCRLYFKNNQTCMVDFESVRPGILIPGQLFVFYNRQLDKGKVIGSGIVEVGGTFIDGEFNTLPINKKESDEEETQTTHSEKLHF